MRGLVADVRGGTVIMVRDRTIAALGILPAAVLFQYGVELVLHVFVATERLGMTRAASGFWRQRPGSADLSWHRSPHA